MNGFPTVTKQDREEILRMDLIRDAAPDLLEALKFIYSHIADPERRMRDLYPAFGLNASEALRMCHDAIDKAEGRS